MSNKSSPVKPDAGTDNCKVYISNINKNVQLLSFRSNRMISNANFHSLGPSNHASSRKRKTTSHTPSYSMNNHKAPQQLSMR